MRTGIGQLVGLPPERVSITAATANLAGDEGAGRVISADCFVVVSGS
jgi:hypothetical protein